MKTRVFIIVGAMLMLFSSISVAQTQKENRKVDVFSKISMSIPADVELIQGSKHELIIEADQDVLEKIETEVTDGKLKIRFEKWYNYRGNKRIKVFVTMKEVEKLTISGSGDIVAKTAIESDRINLVVTGSGSIIIGELITNDVHSVISGSGDVKIEGKSKAKLLDVTITGSGDFDATGLEFLRADFNITGSGTIEALVLDELDANITGSGRIYYKGKPIVDANVTGSGKIRRAD